MPSPAEEEKQKPPHLKTPPYVHHFDTYGLVKDLEKGGFSQEQAVTVMKAVRGILADNMELARDGLVSKSNVENVRWSIVHNLVRTIPIANTLYSGTGNLLVSRSL